MVKKILSYLLSLVIAFSIPKRTDAGFFTGMFAGALVMFGILFKYDRSDDREWLQWKLDNSFNKLNNKIEKPMPVSEMFFRLCENKLRLTALLWACGLFYYEFVFSEDGDKKDKESLNKNYQKSKKREVDNEQKN